MLTQALLIVTTSAMGLVSLATGGVVKKGSVESIRLTQYAGEISQTNSNSKATALDVNSIEKTNLENRFFKPKIGALIKSQRPVFNPVLRLSIPSIGMENQQVLASSINEMEDVYQKMLYAPVVENQISPSPCSKSGNSYIMGHSEPPSKKEAGYPGSNIFGSLTRVSEGDKITLNLNSGETCTYIVTGWESVETDLNNQVSIEEFNKALYPEAEGGTLTIQTCQKGSSTVRLLLRAKLLI